MDIEQMTRGQIEAEFAALARTMYFTKSTIAAFSKDATRGQLVAACELIRSENATREENRKARLMRQAKFPAVKSVADFDFGEVEDADAERPTCRSHWACWRPSGATRSGTSRPRRWC